MSASRAGGFLRDLLLRSGSDIFNVGLNLAIIALVARGLSGGEFGIYTQVITTTSLLIPLLILRLNTACVRFFPAVAARAAIRASQFSRILLLVMGVSMAAALLIVLTPQRSSRLLFGVESAPQLVGLLAAYVLVRCLVTMLVDYFRALNRSPLASAYNSFRFFLVLLGIMYAVWLQADVSGILLAQLLAECTILLLLSIHLWLKRAVARPAPLADIRPYLMYSLPLVPYSLCLAVNQFADRFFITHLVGVEATGVYAFTYNLIAAAFLLNASISYVIYPHLCRLWEVGDTQGVSDQLKLGQRLFVVVAIPAACGLAVIHAPLVSALAGSDFVVGLATAIAIAVGQVFLGLCSLFGFVIDLSKRTGLYLKVLVVTAIVNLALNALLIPVYGIAGAAIATAITYLLQLGLLWWVSHSLVSFPLRVDFSFMVRCLLAASIMVFCLSLIGPIVDEFTIVVAVLVGVVAYTIPILMLLRKAITEARRTLFNQSRQDHGTLQQAGDEP